MTRAQNDAFKTLMNKTHCFILHSNCSYQLRFHPNMAQYEAEDFENFEKILEISSNSGRFFWIRKNHKDFEDFIRISGICWIKEGFGRFLKS